MWACRPFLSQTRTLLDSIRRRRVSITEPPPVALGAASRWLVSDTIDGDRPDDAKDKAAIASARCNGDGEPETPGTSRNAPAPADRRRKGRAAAPAANRSPPAATGEKKHLYLVLDDAKYGFGIHKLDRDANAADVPNAADDDVEFDALPSLPNPPVMRVEHSWMDTFAVLGSNVIGMSSGIRDIYDSRSNGDTLAFDARTAELAVLPDLPNGLRDSCVRLAYDNELCLGGLHCLKLADDNEEKKKKLSGSAADDGDESWCGYTTVNHDDIWALQTRWFWSEGPRMLPLSPEGITAHAVDPSGRAFFVSVHSYRLRDRRGRGTYSYDTEHGFWRRHGGWRLPFVGRAHYDAGLRAWVGLHAHHGSALRGFRPDGHICVCEVPPLNGVAAAPEWKLGKEKLFVQDRRRLWGVVDARLIDMGGGDGGGRFCLVEILTRPGVGRNRKGRCPGGEGEKCVLRLSTFRVEYDGDGELVTLDRRPAGSFRLTRYHDFSRVYPDCWQAFWA